MALAEDVAFADEVPCFSCDGRGIGIKGFVAVGCGDVKLREGGCLADIAPTMLPYIGLPVPAEMTGKSIIVE